MKLRIAPRARADLLAIRAYLLVQHPEAARKVMQEIIRKLRRLEIFPESGAPTEIEAVRVVPIVTYPYLIFYRVEDAEIIVQHVRHSSRQRGEA